MSYADLNELGLASYNELIRLNFLEDKDKELLTPEEIQLINDKIYEKIGDKLLSQILQYNNGKLERLEAKFNNKNVYTQLILLFALCYINNMNLNDYFQIKV